MSFSITPVVDFPPVAPTEAKRNLQFQFNGVDIGRRNTDIVNVKDLSQVFDVSIGVGEHVNTLTLGSVAPPVTLGGWDTDTAVGAMTFSEADYLSIGPV